MAIDLNVVDDVIEQRDQRIAELEEALALSINRWDLWYRQARVSMSGDDETPSGTGPFGF